MLHLFVVLEFTVAERLLDPVPDRSKRATLLLNFGGWELPSQVDPVEIVIVEEPIHRVDEFRSRLRCLGLNKSNILLFFFFLIKFESLIKLNDREKYLFSLNGERNVFSDFHQISFRKKIKCIHSRERDIYESRHRDRRCHLYRDRSSDLGKFSLTEWRVCSKSIRLLCPMMVSEERLRKSLRWCPRIRRSGACRERELTERRPIGIFLALKIYSIRNWRRFRREKRKGEESAELLKIKIKIIFLIDGIFCYFTLSVEGRRIPVAHDFIVLVCVDSEHGLDAEHRNSGEN